MKSIIYSIIAAVCISTAIQPMAQGSMPVPQKSPKESIFSFNWKVGAAILGSVAMITAGILYFKHRKKRIAEIKRNAEQEKQRATVQPVSDQDLINKFFDHLISNGDKLAVFALIIRLGNNPRCPPQARDYANHTWANPKMLRDIISALRSNDFGKALKALDARALMRTPDYYADLFFEDRGFNVRPEEKIINIKYTSQDDLYRY